MVEETSRPILLALVVALPAAALAAGVPSAGAATVQPPNLVDVAEERGLDFECESWNKHVGLSPRWFTDAFFCPTPVVADFNGDGYQDLFFPNQRYPNATLNEEHDPQDRFYLNNGDGTFRDVTELVGDHDTGYSMGAAPVDYDGDGDLDIYVANFPSEVPALDSPATTLYVNEGDGTFTATHPEDLETGRVADQEGNLHDDAMFGSAVAVADYDKDGDMDIYRGNYAEYFVWQAMPDALQQTIPETNLLYQNQGDGTFEDVTIEERASLQPGRTFAVNFVDFDQDGYPDLYVANDENANELYLNRPDEDGGRVFEEVFSGAEDTRGAMCSEPADWNNDGNLDLYMSHYEDEHNGYYLGNGDGTFEDAQDLGDLENSYHMLGWGCPAVDVDNDGDRDLFVANGHMTPTGGEFFHPDDPADDNGYALPNQLYMNTLVETGEHSFTEVSELAGPAFDKRRTTSGATSVDLDRDGYEEIIAVNNNDEKPAYLDDEARTGDRFLNVDLASPTGNQFAIGASVTVTAGDLTLTDQRKTGASLASGSVAPLHFGLGDASGPATVTVEWPDGATSTHTVALDQHVRIVQGQGVVTDTRAPRAEVTLSGTPGDGDWFTSDTVSVELSASDAGDGSGLTALAYQVDDGPKTAYDGAFTIEGEGEHQLRVFTEDAAGNTAWYPYRVSIDTEDPTAEITEPDNETIRVQGNDHPSPTSEGRMASPVATPEGPAAFSDWVVEGYAHETARRTGVGAPYPSSTEEALAGTAGSDGETTIRVDASDTTAGADRAVFHVDGEERFVDEEAPFAWEADLRGLSYGEHTVSVTVVDEAGRTVVDERTYEIVPTSAEGAASTAEDPDTSSASEVPDLDDPDEVGQYNLVENLLDPIPEEPIGTAEPGDDQHYYNGVGSYLPANKKDAPIWRQFSFIDDDDGGTVGQYVVLNPETFLTSPKESNIYQFPACQSLDPVLESPLMQPLPSGGEPVPWDKPTRRIVNVQLETGCEVQPTSVEEVEELATETVETELFVNAPKLPEQIEDWSLDRIFNSPPYRPKVTGFQDGEPVKFITYEANWVHPWVGTNFPGENDVIIISPTSTFRDDFTLFNINIGGPNHPEFDKYSPIWAGNCLVAEDNKKCMISVNKKAGFDQCRTLAECLNMESDSGVGTELIPPNTFTHINCPFLAVDTNANDFIEPHEELYFPNLWVDGPVTVH